MHVLHIRFFFLQHFCLFIVCMWLSLFVCPHISLTAYIYVYVYLCVCVGGWVCIVYID
jgi:hypothetical protein